MVLPENKLTEEQAAAETEAVETKRKGVENTLMTSKAMLESFKELNLPDDKPAKKQEVKQEAQEPEAEEDKSEEPQEEVQEEGQEAEKEEAEVVEEDMVPKSKIQPRIDQLTGQIKSLEAELDKIRSKAEPARDELTQKLESMTTEQLKQAKREARMAQRETTDNDKWMQLEDLQEKIDETIRTAPQRFEASQVNRLSQEAKKIIADANADGIKIEQKTSAEIESYASEIYNTTPEFQSSVDGKARALRMAYTYYKRISDLSKGKSETMKLKSQLSNMKKKTGLDTKTTRATVDTQRLNDIQKSAISGTLRDKLRLVKEDPRFSIDSLVPDEYKQER